MCSIARSLEVVGERWSLLIVRDALLGLTRFDEFRDSLGVARNVLTDRLDRLVEHGVFERVRYQDRPARYEYRLTPKGLELFTPLLGLLHWGDRHLADEHGPPRLVEHAGCGGPVAQQLTCTDCGQTLAPGQVHTRPGPALTRHDD